MELEEVAGAPSEAGSAALEWKCGPKKTVKLKYTQQSGGSILSTATYMIDRKLISLLYVLLL